MTRAPYPIEYVFTFAQGDRSKQDLLGGKGANLAEMTRLGLPVPPGFTITTEACRYFLKHGQAPEGLRNQIEFHVGWLQREIDQRLGDPSDPMLVSVRSGGKFSMPGMMDTVLNIGLNDESVGGLATKAGNEHFAWDSYRRLIQMFGKTVLGLHGESFEAALDRAKDEAGVSTDVELPVASLKSLVDAYKGIILAETGQDFPQDPQRATRPCGPRGVQVMEHRPGEAVPPARAHPTRPRDRGQCPDHGLRQCWARFGHRGCVHARPGHRGSRRLRRLPPPRPG